MQLTDSNRCNLLVDFSRQVVNTSTGVKPRSRTHQYRSAGLYLIVNDVSQVQLLLRCLHEARSKHRSNELLGRSKETILTECLSHQYAVHSLANCTCNNIRAFQLHDTY